MLLLLLKSRCMNIAVDVSYQFEPEYLSRMANLIIDNIDMDVHMTKRDGTSEIEMQKQVAKTRNHYVDKPRAVTVEGVEIKICLSGEAYDAIFDKKFLDADNKVFI